jgi:hypothetical protein
MDTMSVISIGTLCALVGGIIGFLTFWRSMKKESRDDGKQDGIVLTELGYIKANTDEIKAEQKEQRKRNEEFAVRLGIVEDAVKSANKRIYGIEERTARHEKDGS